MTKRFYDKFEVLVLLYYWALALAAGFGLVYGVMWLIVNIVKEN